MDIARGGLRMNRICFVGMIGILFIFNQIVSMDDDKQLVSVQVKKARGHGRSKTMISLNTMGSTLQEKVEPIGGTRLRSSSVQKKGKREREKIKEFKINMEKLTNFRSAVSKAIVNQQKIKRGSLSSSQGTLSSGEKGTLSSGDKYYSEESLSDFVDDLEKTIVYDEKEVGASEKAYCEVLFNLDIPNEILKDLELHAAFKRRIIKEQMEGNNNGASSHNSDSDSNSNLNSNLNKEFTKQLIIAHQSYIKNEKKRFKNEKKRFKNEEKRFELDKERFDAEKKLANQKQEEEERKYRCEKEKKHAERTKKIVGYIAAGVGWAFATGYPIYVSLSGSG